jgi:molybdopterin molybdotransferase
VVRYEEVELNDGTATIRSERVEKGQNAQKQGLERRKGELIVREGCRLSPAEAGVASTIGKATVKVARLPRTVIIYTGSELVEVDENPLPHQIRASNVYTIAALLEKWKIQADLLHLPDDELYIRRKVQGCLENYDLILLTGGISKGKYDYVPAALLESGVRQLFYRVAQRPGKPFWFGNVPDGPFAFALPGNPVSAFMCALRYTVPWLRASLGMRPFEGRYAQLSEDLVFKKEQTYFIQVKTRSTLDGRMIADVVSARGSGDLASLADADGFLELPAERKEFKAGETYRYYGYR